jgi:hypothetical protein
LIGNNSDYKPRVDKARGFFYVLQGERKELGKGPTMKTDFAISKNNIIEANAVAYYYYYYCGSPP